MIVAKNVTVKLAGNYLLNQVNFSVNPYELVVILGPNGAGKSTLLKTITADIKLTSGEITLNSQPMAALSLDKLAQIRSVLTQHYDMEFPFKVTDVINMAHYPHRHQVNQQTFNRYVSKTMHELGIEHLADHTFPTLSGGEKQRVQLARAMCQILPNIKAQQPCYLFIDEPTASLDIHHQYEVMKQAKILAKNGAGVVAVIHDLALAASFADRVYILKQGQLVKTGSAREVLTAKTIEDVYTIKGQVNFSHEHALPHLQVING